MRTLINQTDITFANGSRTITVANKVFTRLQLRLLVNETQKVLLTNTLDKDLVTVSENGTDTTITYDSSLPVLVTGDVLAIDIDETVEISGGATNDPTLVINLSFTPTDNFVYYQMQRNCTISSIDNAANITIKKNGVTAALPATFTVGDILTVTYDGVGNVSRVLSGEFILNTLALTGKNIAPVAVRNERWVSALINLPDKLVSYGSAAGILKEVFSKNIITSTGKNVEAMSVYPYDWLFIGSRGILIDNLLYVLNPAHQANEGVSCINLITGQITHFVMVYPGACNIVSDNKYIVTYDMTTTKIIDTATNTIVRTISRYLHAAVGIIVNNEYVYELYNTIIKYKISDGTSQTLSGVSTRSGVIAENGFLYATGIDTFKVDITGAPTLSATIANTALGDTYVQIFNTNNKYIYAMSYTKNSVAVISTLNDTLIARINVGTAPNGAWLDTEQNYLYVCNTGGSTISVIDCTNNTVVASLSCETNNPFFIVPDNSRPGVIVVSCPKQHKLYEFSKLIR